MCEERSWCGLRCDTSTQRNGVNRELWSFCIAFPASPVFLSGQFPGILKPLFTPFLCVEVFTNAKIQHMNKAIPLLIAGGILALASGQQISHPKVPDNIKAPAGEEIVLQAHATGSPGFFLQGTPDHNISRTLRSPEPQT